MAGWHGFANQPQLPWTLTVFVLDFNKRSRLPPQRNVHNSIPLSRIIFVKIAQDW